jgi:hypothetical protein
MPIYLFERTVFPRRRDSPFLAGGGGVTGPGGIEESPGGREGGEGDAGKDKGSGGADAGGRKKLKRGVDHTGPNKGVYVGAAAHGGAGASAAPPPAPPPAAVAASGGGTLAQYPYYPGAAASSQLMQPHNQRTQSVAEDRSITTAVGGLANLGSNMKVEKLGPEISKSSISP